MLESTFFGVMIVALLFTILAATDDELAWPVLAIVSWIICSVTVSGLERPYVVVIGGEIQELTYDFSGGVFLQYLFVGIALVFIGIFFTRVRQAQREALKAKSAKDEMEMGG